MFIIATFIIIYHYELSIFADIKSLFVWDLNLKHFDIEVEDEQ